MISKFIQIIQKIINPKFLQDIDQTYLLNHPRLWASRIHYLIYYSIICSIVQFSLVTSFQVDF